MRSPGAHCPQVKWVRDSVVTDIVRPAGTEMNPPWGLDRLDQKTLPLDGQFNNEGLTGGQRL